MRPALRVLMRPALRVLALASRHSVAVSLVGVVAMLLTTRSAFAQESAKLERIDVQLWPDYDRPAVLVMYRATLEAGTSLPARIAFRIPASVGAPNAVAYRRANDLLVAKHTREVDGEWATIDITTRGLNVQLEYYAPLTVSGGTRKFTYAWPGDMEVASFAYRVLEPTAARNLTIAPPPSVKRVRADGLTMHGGDLGQKAAGETTEIRFSYESDGTLSFKRVEHPATPPSSAPPSSRGQMPPSRSQMSPSAGGRRSPEGDGWFMWLAIGIFSGVVIVWVVASARKK